MGMAGLRLVSVNIERSKHLDRIIPFLLERDPDVVCFQELNESDIPQFIAALGGELVFAGHGMHPADPPEEGSILQGVAIWTRNPVVTHMKSYYVGSEKTVLHAPPHYLASANACLSVDINHAGAIFRIVTTHFTWTPDGEPSDLQRTNLTGMLAILDGSGEFVLCGDFNAPRGGEIFSSLAARYKDNIPSKYTTSIDGALHRAGPLPLMVDGLFSTDAYAAHDVSLESGVSDHCAIVATVVKR